MKKVHFGEGHVSTYTKYLNSEQVDDNQTEDNSCSNHTTVRLPTGNYDVGVCWKGDYEFAELVRTDESVVVLIHTFETVFQEMKPFTYKERLEHFLQYSINEGKEIYSLFNSTGQLMACFGEQGWTQTTPTRSITISIIEKPGTDSGRFAIHVDGCFLFTCSFVNEMMDMTQVYDIVLY